MCVYLAIIATFLAVTLWFINNGAALKSSDYGLESLLAGHLEKSNVYWRQGPSM